MDRNRQGGGVLIYIREDILSKELDKHTFTKNVEGLFVEVKLKKMKLLFFGTYHSTHEYGLKDIEYFEQVGLALDVYSNYDKFLLAGDITWKKKRIACEISYFTIMPKTWSRKILVLKELIIQDVLICFLPNLIEIFNTQLQ